MTKQEVINAANEVWYEMRGEMVPYDTGNLAMNALTFEVYDDLIDITVDESIAPYMPYTNEPWLSDKWNGKENPNEGWWGRFAAELARRLASKLRGELR